MSRKQKKDESWATVKQWTLTHGYSPYKASNDNRIPHGTVVIVHHEKLGEGRHPLVDFTPALEPMFTEATESYTAPPLVLILDLTRLDMSQLELENSKLEYCKSGVGKATARAIEKLGLSDATVVTTGKACSLFMKLLITAERLKPKDISRLVMLHPDITPAAVNGLLVRRGGKIKGYGNALEVDVYFDSQKTMDKRLSIVRGSFPKGDAKVLDGKPTLALLTTAITGVEVAPATDLFDPAKIDDIGKSIHFGELQVIMHSVSKQYIHASDDITSEMHSLWRRQAADVAAREAKKDEEAAAADGVPLAGALVLRGSRCVLVRSLASPSLWPGMKLPAVAVKEDGSESYVEAATRALTTFCEVDGPGEIIHMKHIPPVMVYGSGQPYGPVLLHFFSAACPPPPGPLEDADVEDEEDFYDWYTYPRAVEALRDQASRRALQTAAMALNAAAAAGRLPSKWRRFEGGVFGQELFEGSGLQLTAAVDEKEEKAAVEEDGAVVRADLSGMDEEARKAYLAEVEAYEKLLAAGGDPNVEQKPGPDLLAAVKKVVEEKKKSAAASSTGAARSHENRGDCEEECEKEDEEEMEFEPIPVTVLSGFLGAGKTTLMKHILENQTGMRVAVIVNDMGDVNVDASLIKHSTASVKSEEKMVELTNGCICCTLREDLFVELATLASVEDPPDYILIESSGISEPMPVAETFTFTDDTGACLGDITRLDTLVTVVDGSSFLDELYAADMLRNRGWQVTSEDERTVAQLFCDQLEFANVIVMNKMDLMDDTSKARLRSVLKRFNPEAHLIESTYSAVDPALILGTNLFELSKAEQQPDWLKEARIGEHVPESLEYGIGSFTYRSLRPFHPARFRELARAMETRVELMPEVKMEGSENIEISEANRPALRVVRSKGIVWIACGFGQSQQGIASLAGRHFTVSPGPPWWASISKDQWPEGLEDKITPLWNEPWGDRQNELVVIGQDMDGPAVRAALDACLLTDEEMGENVECWDNFENPWQQAWDKQLQIAEAQQQSASHDHGHDHSHGTH